MFKGHFDSVVINHFNHINGGRVAGAVAKGTQIGAEDTVKAVLDIFRLHFASAVELDVLAQMENVGDVIGLFPGQGELGDDIEVII